MGEAQKAFETNHWIVAEHPDYLFGKLNLANEYYLKGEYEKMPEILGEAMDLKSLYPEREVFHIHEVLSFFRTSILYFIAIDDMGQANLRLDLMEEIDPDSPEVKMAQESIMKANFISFNKRMEEEEEASRKKVERLKRNYSRKTEAPQFQQAGR